MDHRGAGPPGLVRAKTRRCAAALASGCAKVASFGPPGAGPKEATHCRLHCPAGLGYQNVRSRRCVVAGCLTQPSYGTGLLGTVATHCYKHRPENYANVKSKRCAAAGCVRRPTYAPLGARRDSATHCSKHAPYGHRPADKKGLASNCAAGGCAKCASFGWPGTRRATHCADHRLDGHCNVRVKRCVYCDKIPSFAPPGGTRGDATHCGQHRLDGYQNVITSICAAAGCFKRATHCFPVAAGERPPSSASWRWGARTTALTHCAAHKLDGHVSRRRG